MIVGKTASSITKKDIFRDFSEAEVLSSVFPEVSALPCLMQSPIRQDRHPSFALYPSSGGHIRFIDYATRQSGDLLDLLCLYWGCSYEECILKLGGMLIGHGGIPIASRKARHVPIVRYGESHLEVKIREWEEHDIEYWHSYGCSIRLLQYAEVYPISHKIVYKDGKKYTFAAPRYSYVFCEHKEGRTTKKIYSPFAKKYKWVTDSDGSVIGLWSKVPQTGDCVCICSSLKDSIALWTNSGIPCVYLQGEGFHMSDTAIRQLRERFRTVLICLDNDVVGIQNAMTLASDTGFINVVLPPFQGGKDISDYIKVYGRERFKQDIVPLFTKHIKSDTNPISFIDNQTTTLQQIPF